MREKKPDTSQKLIMLRWLQASGKSTKRRQLLEENPDTYAAVNKDTIRKELIESGEFKEWSKAMEKKVIEIRDMQVYWMLCHGLTVIVDDTNLNPIHERELRELSSKRPGVKFEIMDFHTPLEECIRRDALRPEGERVGEKVIRDTAAKWKHYDFEPVLQDPSLSHCVIFDIDGTLAKMEGRSPYDYSKVSEDSVHGDIKELLDIMLQQDFYIIICSGRPDTCGDDTVKWLIDKWIITRCRHVEVRMRKAGDERNDAVVKREMIEEIIKTRYIKYWFDDRDRVVRMVRQSGIRCLQVAEGNF